MIVEWLCAECFSQAFFVTLQPPWAMTATADTATVGHPSTSCHVFVIEELNDLTAGLH